MQGLNLRSFACLVACIHNTSFCREEEEEEFFFFSYKTNALPLGQSSERECLDKLDEHIVEQEEAQRNIANMQPSALCLLGFSLWYRNMKHIIIHFFL